MSFSINFPAYGTITVSLDNVAQLRAYAATTQPQVIDIFGRGPLAMGAPMGAAMVGLLLAGPLGRVKIQKGDREVDLEGKPDD